MGQQEFFDSLRKVNDFYAAQDGLQRPGGMVIGGSADIEALGQWGWQLSQGVPLNLVITQIKRSDEWKVKHANDPAPPTPTPSPSHFPPEKGDLTIQGRRFHQAEVGDGRWSWRGVSMFLLAARFFAGEDITPTLDWMVSKGRNVARVFWTAPFADPSLNWMRPWERPDFAQKAGEFLDLCQGKGVRVENTILTYAFPLETQRAYVQQMLNILASRKFHLLEVANEPENNGIDPVRVMEGVDRKGVLSAYGLDPARFTGWDQPDPYQKWHDSTPTLDYGTTHDLQRDLQHSSRNTKDAKEMQDLWGIPFIPDEPIGVIDPGYPGYGQTGIDEMGFPTFGHIGGGGARTTNLQLIMSACAIAHLYTPGYTLHIQAGLDGRAPRSDEAVQNGAVDVCVAVESFIPPGVQEGAYVRPNLGDFGLTWASDDSDSRVGHAYGSVIDGQWVVVPLPKNGWSPTPINGWKVGSVGPAPFILRLGR